MLSEGGGADLTIWSASRAGSSVADAAEHYQWFVEASATPDAVLVTLGHSSGGEDVAAGLDALIDQIDEDVPVLDLRSVTPGYPTAEQWATAFQEALDGA